MHVCCAKGHGEPQLTATGGAGDRQCWGQRSNLLPLHFPIYSEIQSALS